MSITKRLFSGTIQLTASSVLVRLLSFATIPILTAWLAPEAYGTAALMGTAISLASVLALAGIDMSYIRAFHSATPPSGTSVERFCWRFAMTTALPGAMLAGVAWWLMTRQSTELNPHLATLVALGVVFAVINAMTQTRAFLNGRYRAIAWTTLTTGIVGAAASIGIAAFRRHDAAALIAPLLLAYVLPVFMLGMPSIAALKEPSGLKRDQAAAVFKTGLANIVTSPMYWLLSSSDRWFLVHYHGTEAVGFYAVGYNFAFFGVMVNTAVMTVWFPEAAREYENNPELARATLGRLMSRLIACLALVWVAVTASGGDMVLWLANERFHAATEFVPYIAGGVFFYGASQLAMYGLALVKQLKWAALWWFAAGLIGISLNYALVQRFGGMGAAITQTISFACLFIGILLTSQSKYRLELEWSRLAIVVAICLGAGLIMIKPWHAIPALSILMKLPIGITASLVVGWTIAPDWYARALKKVSLQK